MNFAEKLQVLRKSKGMSQEKLADEIGVSRQAVSKWELGISLPDMDKLIVLSDFFGVSLDYLVKDSVADPSGTPPPMGAQNGGPAWPRYSWIDYEYKSSRTLFGLPLVHINVGRGMKKAWGIIAIGTMATGLLSFGLISVGVLSFGVLSAGLIGIGAFALGLLAAVGAISVGTLAIGGVAFGIVAIGGAAIGMFSLGGYASASRIAIGGSANGVIAIGKTAKGLHTIMTSGPEVTTIQAAQVRALIGDVYPNLWPPIRDFILSIFS